MSKAKRSQGKITKNEVIAGRGDLSPFLVHLTRTGEVKLAADIYGQRLDDNKKIFAKKNLQSIIEKSAIKAISPFGYFNYKVRLERPGRPPKNKLQSAKRVAIHSFILIRPINLSLPVWMQLLFQRIVSE